MTRKQRLLIEQSEVRQRLNELLDKDERSDDEASELETRTARAQALEPELRAAIVAEGDAESRAAVDFGDPAARALSDLESRASVADVFGAVLEHRATNGATAELQTHRGLAANQVPVALLRSTVETRAVTPSPGQVAQNQSPIIPGVFPASCAEFLAIDMPTVPVGDSVYPVLTTNADVGVPDENDVQAETTGAFSASVLSPGRLQASFFYSRESRASFAGMDEALRSNLSDALSDKLDQQILAGSKGLFAGTILANHAASAVTTYANYRNLFGYGRVDGTYATGIGDIRVVTGAGTYGHMAGVFRSANAGDRAALEDLMNVTGGVKVSAHVPAVSNSHKQNAVIRLGMRRDMVAPIWEGITLIPDEVTKAGAGQIVITAVMLHAVQLLRAGGFFKQESQHA